MLFQRDLDPVEAARMVDPAEERMTADATEQLSESSARHGRITVKAAAQTLWRLGKMLLAVGDELDKRPKGRFYHRMLGAIPLVGIAGDYFGERCALKRSAKAATKWIAART